jgi:hypothetical protein
MSDTVDDMKVRLLDAAHAVIEASEKSYRAGVREALDKAIQVARGCRDYGGGYRTEKDLDIYHHGMNTVERSLTALRDKPEDTQIQAVLRMGAALDAEEKEAQNG